MEFHVRFVITLWYLPTPSFSFFSVSPFLAPSYCPLPLPLPSPPLPRHSFQQAYASCFRRRHCSPLYYLHLNCHCHDAVYHTQCMRHVILNECRCCDFQPRCFCLRVDCLSQGLTSPTLAHPSLAISISTIITIVVRSPPPPLPCHRRPLVVVHMQTLSQICYQ